MTEPLDFEPFLTRQLQHIRKDLTYQFQRGHWEEVAATLEALAKLGEGYGQKELCLRAQSLREIMGHRGSGRESAGGRVYELFNQLMFYVSHLQWKSQENH